MTERTRIIVEEQWFERRSEKDRSDDTKQRPEKRLVGGWKLAAQLRAEAEKWNRGLWSRKDREVT
jgi:hypothetical protein